MNWPLREQRQPGAVINEIIWSRFGVLYGARWREAGNNRDDWAAELAEFNPRQLAYAVDQAERNQIDWPPTLVVFKTYCKQWRPPLVPVERRIPPARSKEVSSREIAKIRTLLNL